MGWDEQAGDDSNPGGEHARLVARSRRRHAGRRKPRDWLKPAPAPEPLVRGTRSARRRGHARRPRCLPGLACARAASLRRADRAAPRPGRRRRSRADGDDRHAGLGRRGFRCARPIRCSSDDGEGDESGRDDDSISRRCRRRALPAGRLDRGERTQPRRHRPPPCRAGQAARRLLLFGDRLRPRACSAGRRRGTRGRWHELATPAGPVRATATIRPRTCSTGPPSRRPPGKTCRW